MLDTHRPAGQMVSRTVRITLGGQAFDLPVRSIRANREWRQRLSQAADSLIENLEPAAEWAEVVQAFAGHEDELIDILLSYDTTGVLSRDFIEDIEPDATLEVLQAIREVGRVANPTVAIAALRATMAEIRTSPPSAPTSSRRPRTAGRRTRSKTN